jgi:putative transposase
LQETIDCLIQHIPLETQGAFNALDLYQIIENTSKILKQATCGKNIRYHPDKINDFEELETNINSALKSRKLPGIASQKLKLAIDLNLIPYYGNPNPEEMPYIYRSQAKSGTCSFYAYATFRASLKIDIKTLYLDRGFFSISVIRWLKALRIPFIMPAIKTGKTGGIKQFLQGQKSYKTTYTMQKNKEDSVTFNLCIVCKYKKGKRKQHGFSFLLVNIWVNLLWRKVSLPRRGGRLIYRDIFPFQQMLSFLRQAIDGLYQVVDTIYFPSG